MIEKQVVLYSCLTPEGTINLRLAGELHRRDRSVPFPVLGEWKEDMGEGNGEGPETCPSITPGARELDVIARARRRRRRRKAWWVSAVRSVGFGKWEFEARSLFPLFVEPRGYLTRVRAVPSVWPPVRAVEDPCLVPASRYCTVRAKKNRRFLSAEHPRGNGGGFKWKHP